MLEDPLRLKKPRIHITDRSNALLKMLGLKDVPQYTTEIEINHAKLP